MLDWIKSAGTSLVNLFSGPRRSADDERDYAPSPYGREKVKTAPKNVPAFLPWFDENQSLGETPEMRRAYRLMLADPNIKAAILSKLFGVMSLDLTVSPARKKDARDGAIADFVRWNLANAMHEGMAGLIWDILSGALIDGISICEPVWELEDDGKYRGKRYLRRLKALDVGNAVVPIIDEHRNIVAIRGLQYNAGEEWDPDEFVITQHLGLFENPLGMSDFRAAYGRWWILDSATKLRAMGAERRAFGIVSAEYPDVTKQASLEEALSNLRYRHWMAVPEGTKLQVLDLAGQSSSYFSEQRKDLQEEIFLAINGAILQATTSGEGQNRGASTVHKDTADLRAWHLRTMVTHVLNDHKRGLIRRMVDKNFLGVEGYPKASLGGVDEAELKESLAIDKDLKQAFGWKFNREELEERYGRKWEDDPEKALPDAPPPGMPGMGGMPGMDGGQPAMPQGPQAGGGGDLPPPIVPSSKPAATFSEEPADGDDLAALYVDLLNALEESGESYDDTLDAASDELDSMGWTLDQDDDGVWSAKRYGGSVAKFAEGDWTKQQGPRGGTYWVNKANPNRKVYRKDNPGSTREDKAQRRKDRGSVDVDALRKRLTAHAGEQTKAEAKRTNAAYRTLKRHHGELTVHRLEELADTLQKALDGLPEGREGLMGEHLRRQLRGVGVMLDAANKDGVSGVVEPQRIRKKLRKSPNRKTSGVTMAREVISRGGVAPAKAAASMDATKRGGDNRGMRTSIDPAAAKTYAETGYAAAFRIQDAEHELPTKSRNTWNDDEDEFMPGVSGYANMENALDDMVFGGSESVTGENYTSQVKTPSIVVLAGKSIDGPGAEVVVPNAKVAAQFTQDDVRNAFLDVIREELKSNGDENMPFDKIMDEYSWTSNEKDDILRKVADKLRQSAAKAVPSKPAPKAAPAAKVAAAKAAAPMPKPDQSAVIRQGLDANDIRRRPKAKPAPSEVQEAAEIPDAKPSPKPAAKPAAPPPAVSSDDDWGAVTQVEPGSVESISSTLQMDPQGDGISERLDKVYDQVKSEVPNLTTARWKAFLQKAWDAKAIELQGVNEVRHIHEAGGLDKVPVKKGIGMDRVLAYAIVKDPKKLQALIQSDLL